MARKMSFALVLELCLLMPPVSVNAKNAIERPFKIHGTQTVTVDFTAISVDEIGPYALVTITGYGQATHIGRFELYGEGRLYLELDQNGVLQPVYALASGVTRDVNHNEINWESSEVFGSNQGTVVFTDGTGRFEDTVGWFGFSYEITVPSDPGPIVEFTYDYLGAGTVTY